MGHEAIIIKEKMENITMAFDADGRAQRRIDITPKPESPKSYVLGDSEVKLTGRKAQKTLKSGTIDVQYEVTPVHSTSGSWKKWVLMSELLLIVDDNE